jgi:hypothetical protein
LVQTIDINAQGCEQGIDLPVPFDAANASAPSANTAAVVTVAADPARGTVLSQIHGSYSGAAPAGGNLKVEDGAGNTVWQVDVTAQGPFEFTFTPPLIGGRNTALVVTLAAGGASCVGKLNVNARRHL